MKFEDFIDFYGTFGIIEVRAGWFLKMDHSLLVHHLPKAKNQGI